MSRCLGLASFTPATITDPRLPEVARQEIVAPAYAPALGDTALGETDGQLAGVAVPNFDHSREVVVSLSSPRR